jgi:sporulation protein YlmC with PRC-barrel domain
LTRLEFGELVHCADGSLGVLSDIVLEPLSRRVTHLVVRPHDPLAQARLVPYELVRGDAAEGQLTLGCTVKEAHGLESVRAVSHTALDQAPVEEEADWEVGVQDVQPVPHYDAGAFVDYGPTAELEVVRVYDRIPKGHVEVRRESTVTTGDGHTAGTLQGMVFEGAALGELILGRGHLWWKRQVIVPVEDVASVETDEIVIRSSTRRPA